MPASTNTRRTPGRRTWATVSKLIRSRRFTARLSVPHGLAAHTYKLTITVAPPTAHSARSHKRTLSQTLRLPRVQERTRSRFTRAP
jgi:hypothetical protein